MSLLANWPGSNRSETAAVTSRIARCAVDWLMPKIAASARSVRLVRNATSVSSTRSTWVNTGGRPSRLAGRVAAAIRSMSVGSMPVRAEMSAGASVVILMDLDVSDAYDRIGP